MTLTRLFHANDSEGLQVRKFVPEETGSSRITVDDKEFLYDCYTVDAVFNASGNLELTVHWSGYGPSGLLSIIDKGTDFTVLAGCYGQENRTILMDSAVGPDSPPPELLGSTMPFARNDPIWK